MSSVLEVHERDGLSSCREMQPASDSATDAPGGARLPKYGERTLEYRAGRRAAGLPGRIGGGVRVGGGAVLADAGAAGVGEAGGLDHREEDLPRHGTADSVGPGGVLRDERVVGEPHVADLQPAARAQDAEDLPEGGRL